MQNVNFAQITRNIEERLHSRGKDPKASKDLTDGKPNNGV